jgi:ketosteroid isomerase-like protein
MIERASPPAWVTEFYASVDSGDGPGALSRMSADVELQVGSRPPVSGREAAGATLGAFHQSFDRVSHEIHHVWEAQDTVICEFTATYQFEDGRRLPLPSLTVLRRSEDQITHMRVYIDEGALRDRAAMK